MDITSIAALSINMTQTQLETAVETRVLKSALDINEQSVMALIETVAPASQANNPPHLGNQVDTLA